MTKANMATALTWYYPRTSLAYWMRHNREVVALNYERAVSHYGLMPTR